MLAGRQIRRPVNSEYGHDLKVVQALAPEPVQWMVNESIKINAFVTTGPADHPLGHQGVDLLGRISEFGEHGG